MNDQTSGPRIKCLRCGRWNPPGAVKCECGLGWLRQLGEQEADYGDGIQKYLVGVIAFVLLVFGPATSFPLRLLYLILGPALAWLILLWIWKVWSPNKESERWLIRMLARATVGALLCFAVMFATADKHSECATRIVQTRDGSECLGDEYVTAPGPDWGHVVTSLLLAGGGLWIGVKEDWLP